MSVGNSVGFLLEYLKAPAKIGAVCSTAPRAAAAIIDYANIRHSNVIVEVGAGTGPITEQIVEKLPQNALFVAVELNQDFAGMLHERFPGVKVHCDSVENVERILAQYHNAKADSVISSLPWSVFPADFQDRVLKAIHSSLGEGGTFSAFVYFYSAALPGGARFLRKLRSTFSSVERSKIIWNSFPPGVVWTCKK